MYRLVAYLVYLCYVNFYRDVSCNSQSETSVADA